MVYTLYLLHNHAVTLPHPVAKQLMEYIGKWDSSTVASVMTPTTQSKVKLAEAYVLGWVGHEFAEGKLCHCLVTAASHVRTAEEDTDEGGWVYVL